MPEPIDLGRIQIIKALMDAGKLPPDVGVSPQGTMYPNSVSFGNAPLAAPISQQIFRNANQGVPAIPATAQAPVFTQAPTPQIPDGMGGEEKKQQPKSTFFRDVILPLLPSLIATGVGTAFPGALAGAAGFSQGYGGAMEKGRERQLEKDKITYEKNKDLRVEEDKRWNEAYDQARYLLQKDPYGTMEGVSPDQLANKAAEVYKQRWPSTKEIAKGVQDEALRNKSASPRTPPLGAVNYSPSLDKYYDAQGNEIK